MNLLRKIIRKPKSFSPVQIVTVGFLIVIFIGTILLMIPDASRPGQSTDIMGALFTSVSCTCVTGLSLYDTWTHWSEFGQVIMLLLIEIGALGLVSFTTGLTLFLHRRLGLRDMKIVQEGIRSNIIDVPRMICTIFFSTFLFESLGFLLLCSRLVPKYGTYGIWTSAFLSISAYCNAGFDITGFISPGQSLSMFSDDPFIMCVISGLIVIGGLGFIVIVDIYSYFSERFDGKYNNVHLSLHSKIVLRASAVLILLGTALFFLAEYNNTLLPLSIDKKLVASFMQSVSTRTAGMFSIDPSKQYSISKLISIALMFIGASPASTGGGIKTVAFVVILATMWSTLCGHDETIILRRKIEKSVVYRSISIVAVFVIIISLSTLALCFFEFYQEVASIDILYEVVSAMTTTGLSTGITPNLSVISKCILILLMFMGRVGPISLMLAIIARKNAHKHSMLPEGKIIIS